MPKTTTPGQELAATLRRYFQVGTRTRRYRKSQDLHAAMVEAIEVSNQYPGYYNPEMTASLAAGHAVARSYRKHVDGYRIDGVLRLRITEMSPWQFAALLGRMVDAGVTNVGEGERFFADMARTAAAVAA